MALRVLKYKLWGAAALSVKASPWGDSENIVLELCWLQLITNHVISWIFKSIIHSILSLSKSSFIAGHFTDGNAILGGKIPPVVVNEPPGFWVTKSPPGFNPMVDVWSQPIVIAACSTSTTWVVKNGNLSWRNGNPKDLLWFIQKVQNGTHLSI